MRGFTYRRWQSISSSIQGKIFLAFSLVALLSIFSVSGIVYVNMRETIKSNAVTSVSDSIRQADESLNIMLEEIDRLNTVVVINKNTVIDTLLSPSEEISHEWFQEQKRIEEFLSSLIAYKPYIKRIAVVALNGKVFFSGGPWIDRTFLDTPMMDYMLRNGSRHAYLKQEGGPETISVGREIRYDHETIGVVLVDLNYDFIRKTYGVKPTADSMLYVLDQQDEFIYQSDQMPAFAPSETKIIDLRREYAASSGGEAVQKKIEGRQYIVVSQQSEYTGWTTFALIPLDSLLTESANLRRLLLEAAAIVLLIVLVGSLKVSSRITLNLRRLQSMMMLVKDGNLTFPKKEIKTKDEVGQLYHVFIGMVEELQRLLEGIRVSEQEKRKAELTALQAQVRPHFLYNALNTIKYLAKLNGTPNIEEVSGALIDLMRGVLGNANEYLTVREELEYVRNYLAIVKYRYMEPIALIEQIDDPALLNCPIIKLTLQPIVENAVLHGIGSRMEGSVTIRVYEVDGDLMIEVEDNGKGISEEQIEQLLGGQGEMGDSSRFSSMGVRNVHERITRLYKEPYGLKVYSEVGRFTKVTIRFPKLGEAVAEPEGMR
ncbi:cache domain-containing sensor histidine kinase [Paenibacillus daejeonensis]|uniref:cache domain-containing sensor histidine kinase n=1 Tax=Paenibacillus daejeonensis TaxID=135193 RepID=UPI00037A7FD0|nr:sensor histidine kinase [Paenibacillus daejeonensis]